MKEDLEYFDFSEGMALGNAAFFGIFSEEEDGYEIQWETTKTNREEVIMTGIHYATSGDKEAIAIVLGELLASYQRK